ncbi:YSIRK-type signal peptide-containing protein, partial [uncultured Streptococcus sp.]|uniref:YSIRK-type signal peptide-containing protein n=1 Tax=uncultured Streptococcus sp. TaxID=83427 RepID=UPI0028D73339
MRKSNREVNGEKVFRYSIRKYHFGAASVAVAALMFFANGAVKADTLPVSPVTANTEKVDTGVTNLTEGVPLEKSLEAEGNKEIVAPESAEETSNKEDGAGSNAQGANEIKVSDKAVIPANQTEEINKVETNIKEEAIANKDKLEALLNEIDKLNLKTYTEESVKVLQQKVAKAKEVLVNAKTQKEIDSAYNELVAYKSSGLKRVPKLKENNTPKPDTTGGKETVGKKAENTEPNGTNIAGHNHSLAGTTLPEGSGFRTAPAGDVTFYLLDGSMETEAGRAPDARYILKFRRGQGYIPQYSSATTTGAYLDYTGQRREGEFILRTFATRGSNAEVGTYDFRLRFTDSKTGEVYVDQSLRVNVKPNKPTVTVENLENAAGKRAVVNSTARNSNDSVVEFYLNNIKKATITAVNGKASWMPDEALQAGDRITTKNIARDRERIPATYGGDINVARSTSEMSNAVTIPVPVAPKVNLDEVKRQAKESIATAATQ